MSCKSMINFSSLRLDNSIQFLNTSPIRIGLKFMFLNFGSNFSENFLFLSFKENLDCFVFHFATWFFSAARVSPFLSVWKMTELATNFLHKSDKLVFGSLVLLAPEWTVVKRALSRWSHRRVPRHTSTRAPCLCRRIPPGRSCQQSPSSGSRQGAWAHNLWEEWILPEGATPRLAEAQWFIALALSTWKKEFRTEYR